MSQPTPDGLQRPQGRLQLRLGALGVIVVVLFMLLVLRLWALQVLNTRTFVAQAASNHEKQVIVRAPRGEILDRNGHVLVRNRVAYELDLDPGAVRDEAVELAKTFSTEDSGRFVNGILSAIVPELRGSPGEA